MFSSLLKCALTFLLFFAFAFVFLPLVCHLSTFAFKKCLYFTNMNNQSYITSRLRVFVIGAPQRSIRVLDERFHERLLVELCKIPFHSPNVLGGYAKWALSSEPTLEQSPSMVLNPLTLRIPCFLFHHSATPRYMLCKGGHHCPPFVTEGREAPFFHNSAHRPSLDDSPSLYGQNGRCQLW